MTVHQIKITRPDEENMAYFWKLYNAASRNDNRWGGWNVHDIAEELKSTDLDRKQKLFLLRAWQVLVDDQGGFGRLMSAYDTYVLNMQDPEQDVVAWKPEIIRMSEDADLLPVFMEAYEEALLETRRPLPIGELIQRLEEQTGQKWAPASIEEDPVAYADPQAFLNFQTGAASREWMWRNPGEGLIPLFSAPPAQVSVPDEMTPEMMRAVQLNSELGAYAAANLSGAYGLFAEFWKVAHRAAMLQPFGSTEQLDTAPAQFESLAGEPVSQRYTLPANTVCKDAPEHIWLQTAGVWPESGEFSELTWCSSNQHQDDTLYVRADLAECSKRIAYDITGFGRFVAREIEGGELSLEFHEFHFENGSFAHPDNQFAPKYAVQALINRLQAECDSMVNEPLVDILSASAAPQPEVKS